MNIGRLTLQLTLCSVADFLFFADSRQIQKVSDYTGTEEGLCIKLHEVFCLDNAESAGKQVVFSIKNPDRIAYNIVTDNILDSMEVSAGEIKPLPALIEPYAFKNGAWGAVLYSGRPVLLVDFMLLHANIGAK